MNPPTTDNDNSTTHHPSKKESEEERITTDRWITGNNTNDNNRPTAAAAAVIGDSSSTEAEPEEGIKLSASSNKRRWSNESKDSSSSCGSSSPRQNKRLKTVRVGALHDSTISSSTTPNSSKGSHSPMTLLNLGSAIVHARRASLSSSSGQQSPVHGGRGDGVATSMTTLRRRQSDRKLHYEILADSLRETASSKEQEQAQEASTTAEDLGYEPVVDLGYNNNNHTEPTEPSNSVSAADLGYGVEEEQPASTSTIRRLRQQRQQAASSSSSSSKARYLRRNSFVIHEKHGRAGNFPWAAMDFLYQHPPGSSRDSFLQDRRLSAGSSS